MELNYFKQKLEEEKRHLEERLSSLGRRNPKNPNDWEPTFAPTNPQESAADELADKFEEMENAVAAHAALEERVNRVDAALAKIANGTYGTCQECGASISRERLEADPAAECVCQKL